jgi:hypothetical protein
MSTSPFLTVVTAGVLFAACRATPAPVPDPVPEAPGISAVPISDVAMVPPPPADAEVVERPWQPAPGRMMTRWAADVRPDNVLPEYPRPQMVRTRWQNLNGIWQVAVGYDTNSAPTAAFGASLPGRILVPFAIESALSGIGSHANGMVYRRTFRTP